MDKIRISGVKPYDGDWNLDLSHFTNREWGIIKRLSGVLPDTFKAHALAGDAELIVALAVIALKRNGIDPIESKLWDADAGLIAFVADESQAEEDDDEVPLEDTRKMQPGADGTGSETPASSGLGFANGSASRETDLSATGTPA